MLDSHVHSVSWDLGITVAKAVMSLKWNFNVFVFLVGYFLGTGDAAAAPVFDNLPNNLTVYENTAVGTTVFTVLVSDSDGDNMTAWWSSSPPEGSTLFTLGPVVSNQLEVTTTLAIDFETVTATSFIFTITLSDTNSMSTTGTLTLSIGNVNENLSWNAATYRTDVPDGSVAGFRVPDPGFSITDLDNSDTFRCYMDCAAYNGYFSMSTACNITVTSVYSLDVGLGSTVLCVVTAVDGGANTASTTLTISIVDVNNYTPVFGLPSYPYTVSPYASVGTTIGTVTATDGDTGTYGSFSYSLEQTTPTHYFQIDASSGQISTQLDMSTCSCPLTTFTMPVKATDQGGLVGTSTVFITTSAATTTQATTTTVTFLTFFDDKVNVVWFSLLMVLLFVTLFITVFILVKYVCTPKKRHKRHLIPKETSFENKSVRRVPPPVALQAWRNETAYS